MLGLDHESDQQSHASAAPRRRQGWRRALLIVPVAGLALLVGGAVLALTADGPGEIAVVAGNDVLVTSAASIVDAHNSPSLARNPDDADELVVASKVDRPRFLAALHASRDGGDTWTSLSFPTPAGEDRPYAPELVWTEDGVLHLSFVTLAGTGNSPDAVWLSSSTDAGRTWETPREVLGAYAFQVRMAADPSGENVYLTWLQADRESTSGLLSFSRTGLPIMAMRSDDGGESFGEPVQISATERLRVGAAEPQVLPNGDLAVLYYDFRDDRRDFENLEGGVYDGTFALVLARSGPDLQDVTEEVVEDEVVPTERFLVYLPKFASLATGPDDGELYVAWADGRNGDRDVFLRRSDDGGRSWASAVQVNAASEQDQYQPAVSVAASGRVDVVYLDRSDEVLTAAAYAVSADNGQSWSTIILSTRQFSSEVGPGSELDMPDQGTRADIVSGDDGAAAVWTDARQGTEDTGKLDVYFARVTLQATS